MKFPNREVVEELRKEFPRGTEVILDSMNDMYREMPSGMRGTVVYVDDTGTIFCHWENGSGLGVVYGVDRCHKES